MIFRLVKSDAGALLDVTQRFFWKIHVPIQTGPDGGAAKRDFAQNFNRSLAAFLCASDLLGVTGKFLAEADRRCVHQMSAADLNDIPKFLCFRLESGLQLS